MKMNHEWTRIDTKTDGPASTTSGAKMLLQFGALGVTMSWDDGLLGARASRPHQAWHSLGHLPHLDQPGTAPWLSFGLADAVPAHRVAACSIALKLSGGQRDRMRAGRPRSQGNHSPLEGESQKPSRQAKADAVGGWRATSQKADVRPLGNSRLPASPAPAPPRRGGSFESETGFVSGKSGPHPGVADHSRVKQPVLIPIGSRGHVSLIRLAASLNMATQDRHDKQDEKLVHKKLIGSISSARLWKTSVSFVALHGSLSSLFQPLGIPSRIHLLPS